MTIQCSHFEMQVTNERSLIKDAVIVVAASILIALFAPLTIPLYPVPIATQPHVVLLLAALLGSKRGSLAVLAFLLQGAMGLPVFAGATGGAWVFAGPTGGYLIGYLVAAFATGFLVERIANRTPGKTLGAMAVGTLVIYAFGLPWLAGFLGWKQACIAGFLPFVIGDFLKMIVATNALKALKFFK